MRIRWRNLELPTRVVVDRATLTDTYGMFTIEPFERGFGHTIGNGLRRVLLVVDRRDGGDVDDPEGRAPRVPAGRGRRRGRDRHRARR